MCLCLLDRMRCYLQQLSADREGAEPGQDDRAEAQTQPEAAGRRAAPAERRQGEAFASMFGSINRPFLGPQPSSRQRQSFASRAHFGPDRRDAEVGAHRGGAHRVGLDELVLRSADGVTLFDSRSPAIAFQPVPTERYAPSESSA